MYVCISLCPLIFSCFDSYNELFFCIIGVALVCYTLNDLKDAKEVAMAIETAIASKQVCTMM